MDEQFIALVAIIGAMFTSVLTLVFSTKEKNAGVFDKATTAQSEIIDDLIQQISRLKVELLAVEKKLEECLENCAENRREEYRRKLW